MLLLAPMEDVTDSALRRVLLDIGSVPDMWFTEFTNATGLLRAPVFAGHRLVFDSSKMQSPLIAQLWGTDPQDMYKAALLAFSLGFAGVDINMGCPVKNVVKAGAGAALAQNFDLAAELIRAVKHARRDFLRLNSGVVAKVSERASGFRRKSYKKGAGVLESGQVLKEASIPLVTVKTRLGFKQIDLSWIRHLLEQGIDMLTVHFRTAKEMSKVPAHWEYAPQIVRLRDKVQGKSRKRTLLVGNGDVVSQAQAKALMQETGVDGVMIGRGIFKNPWIFAKDVKDVTGGKVLSGKGVKILTTAGERAHRDVKLVTKAYARQVFYFIQGYCLQSVALEWEFARVWRMFGGIIEGGGWGDPPNLHIKVLRAKARQVINNIFTQLYRDFAQRVASTQALTQDDLPFGIQHILKTAAKIDLFSSQDIDKFTTNALHKLTKAQTPCIKSYKPLLKFSKMWYN